MKKSLIKIICLLTIVGLHWAGPLAIEATFAYFNDNETASNNTFSAGTLDFSLSSPQNNFGPRPEVALNMIPGDAVSREIKIQNNGSLSFQYNARAEKISGNDDFCQGLQLFAQLEGVAKYTGGLMNFNFPAIEISDSEDDWFFIISLPFGSNFVNKFCQFKFVFEARQINSSGFFDQEEISSKLASWGVRINEVYYDVDGSHGNELENEWVEIYNQTNQAIDISGWKVCDNNWCDTVPSSSPIPAYGFAVVTAKDTTWNYWTIPPGAVKIILGGEIGNNLHNDGDRVIFQRTDGQEIDAMSYGNDNYAFDPPALDVAEGHSLARKIAGFDTNQAADWQDLATPNPGTNPHSVVDEEKERPAEEPVEIEEEGVKKEPIETNEEELATGEGIDEQGVDREDEEENSQEELAEEEELVDGEITGGQVDKESDNQEAESKEAETEEIGVKEITPEINGNQTEEKDEVLSELSGGEGRRLEIETEIENQEQNNQETDSQNSLEESVEILNQELTQNSTDDSRDNSENSSKTENKENSNEQSNESFQESSLESNDGADLGNANEITNQQ